MELTSLLSKPLLSLKNPDRRREQEAPIHLPTRTVCGFRGRCCTLSLVLLLWAVETRGASPEQALRQLRESADPSRAVLEIRAQERSPYPIPKYITGKFAEHLGANIYNGMDAQILRNPTFADYPFWTGQMSPDGVTQFHSDEKRIAEELRGGAARWGWPATALDDLVAARADGLACWWTRVGRREAVQVSPDTGPHGGRAQRIQVSAAGEGVAQWGYLPLHRIRRYEVEILARSPDLTALSISVWSQGGTNPVAATTLQGLSPVWQEFNLALEIDPLCPSDKACRLEVTANAPGQFLLARVLLRPADHVNGADPDVVRLLRESRLPLLRWPGGNFVSGYHWEDGVGPAERRPTRANYAWGGVEPNLFGTDEFLAFCRAAGCEPMICINAGDGTPEEAARWIEYCNGPATSPMGARRAANGHSEPYGIRHWEVGNELWGRWQFNWTTAAGYVDRYALFTKAMRAADPNIQLYACGAPAMWGDQWNGTLLTGAGTRLTAVTDHPLIGGDLSPATPPLDVYRDFMAVPEALEKKWGSLERQMLRVGIAQPRLAVTELQMFAHLGPASKSNSPARLTHETLVNPGTQGEALYDVLIYHAAVRLAPFVEMVTHSAIINHGGGLRKERERVYANPCYYAQSAFAAFAGATPVAVSLESPMERAPLVLPDLRHITKELSIAAVDAMAALTPEGDLLLSIVNRGSSGPIRLRVVLQDFRAGGTASVRTLSAPNPWDANSLQNPTAIQPRDSTQPVRAGGVDVDLPLYSVTRVRVERTP